MSSSAPFWPAVGGHAGLVRGCVSCECEERSHHVSALGHGDPAGDRNQQPVTSPETPPGHPGDRVSDQPLCPTHLQNGTGPPSAAAVHLRAEIYGPYDSVCLQHDILTFQTAGALMLKSD